MSFPNLSVLDLEAYSPLVFNARDQDDEETVAGGTLWRKVFPAVASDTPSADPRPHGKDSPSGFSVTTGSSVVLLSQLPERNRSRCRRCEGFPELPAVQFLRPLTGGATPVSGIR